MMAVARAAVFTVLVEEMIGCEERIGLGTDESAMLLLLMAAKLVRKERQKVEKYVEGTIPLYYLDDFKMCFRMTRTTFEVICENLGEFQELLPSWSGGRDNITVEKQLLITLWYVASQDTTHNIADRFNVTESSVVRCRDRVFNVFLTHLKQQFIIWPTNNNRQGVIDAFRRKANFPDVLGAIDGTHIQIRAPKEHKDVYINRKGYHSIVLQGVCREDLRFTHVLAGWPGSCHDARVLRNSDLWENGLHLCGNGHLLGDGAYPLRTWLLTPYRDNGHLTPQKRAFNHALSSTRVTVERAFGLLKGRFSRLQYINTRELKTAVDTTVVCTIVHNICIINGDEMQDYFDDDHNANANAQNNNFPNIQVNNEYAGIAKRDALARNFP